MANDFAAIINGFNSLDLTNFTSTSSDALKTALVDNIYTTSGFKYNAATTVVNNEFVFDRTIDTDAPAYVNLIAPAETKPSVSLCCMLIWALVGLYVRLWAQLSNHWIAKSIHNLAELCLAPAARCRHSPL